MMSTSSTAAAHAARITGTSDRECHPLVARHLRASRKRVRPLRLGLALLLLSAASAALGADAKVSPPMELPLIGSMIVKASRIRECPATSLAEARDERDERADTLTF